MTMQKQAAALLVAALTSEIDDLVYGVGKLVRQLRQISLIVVV